MGPTYAYKGGEEQTGTGQNNRFFALGNDQDFVSKGGIVPTRVTNIGGAKGRPGQYKEFNAKNQDVIYRVLEAPSQESEWVQNLNSTNPLVMSEKTAKITNVPRYTNEHFDARIVRALKSSVVARPIAAQVETVNRMLTLAKEHFKGNGSMAGQAGRYAAVQAARELGRDRLPNAFESKNPGLDWRCEDVDPVGIYASGREGVRAFELIEGRTKIDLDIGTISGESVMAHLRSQFRPIDHEDTIPLFKINRTSSAGPITGGTVKKNKDLLENTA